MLVLSRRLNEWIVLDDYLYVEVVGSDRRKNMVHLRVVEWYEDGSFSVDYIYKLHMNNPGSYADIGVDFDLGMEVRLYAGYPDHRNFELGLEAPRALQITRMDEFKEYRDYQKSSSYFDEYGMFGRGRNESTSSDFGWSSYGDVYEDSDEDVEDVSTEVVGSESSKYGSDVSWFFE